MKEVTTTLVLLIASSLAAGHCPKVHQINHCSYKILCINTISDVRLNSDCQGSSNYDVKVEVTLRNASESLHIEADPDFVTLITTLNVHGNWPKTDLPFLDNMFRLRNLNIINNKIQQIFDSPFQNLVFIENIDLSYNKISYIEKLFQFESRPSKMHSISLAYNYIEEVPVYTFEELSSLTELDLSYNHIKEFKEEPFRNLTNLKVLKLNNNKIIDLNGALHKLVNLRHLYLSSNQINKIDMESINTINHLETFDLSKNQIEKIDPTLFPRHWNHFSNYTICRIVLSDNHIVEVPEASIALIERFRKNKTEPIYVYTRFELSNNKISEIDYNAFSLMQPQWIDLSNNKLIKFIVNADDLIHVRYLNLSNNYLSSLDYKSFSSMHNLQNFDLSHNIMENFPDHSLSNTYNLKYVNATFNEIRELHSLRITFHPEGGYLDLSNNGLQGLTIPKNDAVGLKRLVLSYNNISDAYLISLIDQHNLMLLDMSNNFIVELDESSLQLPEQLEYLDLSFNQINKMAPSAFYRLNLKTLKLSHNHLKIIDHGIFRGLDTLLRLDLSFNEITLLDSKVFMDLKQLNFLSLRHNGLNILENDGWFSLTQNLTLILDDNNLSCTWLAKALTDFNRGYSKMSPTVLKSVTTEHSIQGIPCQQEVQNLEIPTSKYMTDERLLILTKKILEAVQDQTSILRKFMWHSILYDAERKADYNRIV